MNQGGLVLNPIGSRSTLPGTISGNSAGSCMYYVEVPCDDQSRFAEWLAKPTLHQIAGWDANHLDWHWENGSICSTITS